MVATWLSDNTYQSINQSTDQSINKSINCG